MCKRCTIQSDMPCLGLRPKRRWVDPEVCTQYGIAATADEAWEANGGGKFSFKIDRAGA